MTSIPPDAQAPLDFRSLKIVVAGDCMLDHTVFGDVTRISPEGPFPVLAVTREHDALGGAGNVYANLKALGVDATIVACLGEDDAAAKIQNLCGEGAGFLALPGRRTTVKTRLVGNGAQMMRVDRETAAPLAEGDEDKMIAAIAAQLIDSQALILSDYGKGSLTPRVLDAAIRAAKAQAIPVLVDPKGRDYSIYKGADVVTPNRTELGLATGCATGTDSQIEAATRKILETSGVTAVVATRSEDGMTVLEGQGQSPVHLKTQARDVYDVSGAGDTVIAVLAAGLAAGWTLIDAAALANRAGGFVVAKAGTATVTADELFAGQAGQGPVSCMAAKRLVENWTAQGLRVGFTNGCFDILHAGHVTYLAEAARHCDRLVVGLNHDKSVRILKGLSRPVNDEESRATVLAGLSSVAAVILFGAEREGEDNTPVKLIEWLKPDVFFKGGDYREDQLPEAGVVRSYGGEVRLMGVVEGKSTSLIIKKIAAG